MSTISKEDYIKAIYELNQSCGFAKPSQIAEALQVSKPAITDMIRKLVRDNYVLKENTGLSLTPQGEKTAIELIRKHRLWETFLSSTLKMDWSEIHEEAENLEHATSENLINKIDAFLKYPKFDPHGSPIPDKSGKILESKNGLPLSSKNKGKYKVTAIDDKNRAIIELINNLNIQLKTEITLKSKMKDENAILVEIIKKDHIISFNIADKIYVD